MKTKEFNTKFNEIAKTVPAMLREYRRAALAGGGIDLAEFEDNYAAPRIVLAAALDEIRFQWSPKSSDKKAVRNVSLTTYPDFTRK